MTYTELFRDFLIENKIRKIFEDLYYINTFEHALCYKGKLSFKDDFLYKEFKKRYDSNPIYFLTLKFFITWDDDKIHDNHFWQKISDKWSDYIENAIEKGLIEDIC